MRCVQPLRAFMYHERNAAGKRILIVSGQVRMDGRGDPVRHEDAQGVAVFLRCGTCVACLGARRLEWALRCMHEVELHERSSFVTLTYDDAHLPYAGSLVKEHLSQFMRELRKEVGYGAVRFFGAGEYGEIGQRPHLHAILFGVDFVADRVSGRLRRGHQTYRSALLDRVWSRGRCEIGSVSIESASYVAGYVSKKLGEQALVGREPEFVLMSNRPGIGAGWFRLHGASVVARDSVVHDGMEFRVPRYYDKLLERWSPEMMEALRERRRVAARERGVSADETMSRLAATEECLLARVNLFAREMAA